MSSWGLVDNTSFFRLYAAMIVGYPIWSIVMYLYLPNVTDDPIGRSAIGFLSFLSLMLSFKVQLIKKNMEYIIYGMAFLIAFHFYYLLYKSGNSIIYIIGCLLLAASSSPAFKRVSYLVGYSVFSACIAFMVPFFNNAPPEYTVMLTAGVVTITLFAILMLVQQIYLNKRVEKETNLRMEAQRQSLEAESQREKAEEQFKAEQKMGKLKDEFLANTSHELRTPLNGIIGIADSLLEGATGQLSEATRKNLSMIVHSGKRLTSLVNNILDFSKLNENKMDIELEPIDARITADIVLELSKSTLGSKKLELVNSMPEDTPIVKASEDRLIQVLHNLVGNALKFTEEGSIEISSEIEGEMLKIMVKDTGIGIAPDKQEQVFASFEQADGSTSRKYGGTGLGLSITKQIIELHGGTIGLTSKEGEGSTFFFTLPLAEQGVDAKNKSLEERSDEEKAVAQKSMIVGSESMDDLEVEQISLEGREGNILVVDDEPINIQVLINHLSVVGYKTVSAQNGREALDKLGQTTEPFDLILLDVMMPVMNGFEFLETVRERERAQDADSSIPIVMLTAKNQINDLVKAFYLGANDYVTKPFIKEELLARVKNHITLANAVTLKVKFKEQLHSEKLNFLGQMIAGVAHEINTPIGTTLTAASLCEKSTEEVYDLFSGNKLKKSHLGDYLTQSKSSSGLITSNVRRVSTLIDNFKMLSVDNHSEEKRSFLIQKYFDITLGLLTAELAKYDHTIEISCPPDLEIYSYPGCLVQIITGLISNSLVHGYEEGTTLEIKITAKGQGDNLLLTYQDNGKGIDPEHIDQIFNPFFTTRKNKGSIGLGLNIIFNLISSKLKGSISCQSQQGEGVTFDMSFPMQKYEPVAPAVNC